MNVLVPSALVLVATLFSLQASAGERRHHHAHKHHPHHHSTHRASSHDAAWLVGGVLLGAALADSRSAVTYSTYSTHSYPSRYSSTTYYTRQEPTIIRHYSYPSRSHTHYETLPNDRCYEVIYRNGQRIKRELPSDEC